MAVRAAIYPWTFSARMRPALLLVGAIHGCAIVAEADRADLVAHAIGVLELGFFGHAVVGTIEAELDWMLVWIHIRGQENNKKLHTSEIPSYPLMPVAFSSRVAKSSETSRKMAI